MRISLYILLSFLNIWFLNIQCYTEMFAKRKVLINSVMGISRTPPKTGRPWWFDSWLFILSFKSPKGKDFILVNTLFYVNAWGCHELLRSLSLERKISTSDFPKRWKERKGGGWEMSFTIWSQGANAQPALDSLHQRALGTPFLLGNWWRQPKKR